MPIAIDQVDSQIEVENPPGNHEPPRNAAPTEALPRWQELARREAQRCARTAAWGFDD